MTVGSEQSKISFTGAGSVAPVIFPYPLHANIELKITVTDALGLVTTAVEGVDYTLVIAGDFQTATVTPLPAWAAFANGKTVEIARLLPYTQAVDLIGNSKLPERVVEQMFDRAAMRDQQLLTLIGETTAAARLRFRGAYSGSLAYLPNDVVVDQNSTWVNTLGGMGVAPPVLPTLTNANWALLARHGDPGSLENSALMVLIETGPVATPPADRLHVYAKDVAGASHLFTKDVSGVEVDLSADIVNARLAGMAEGTVKARRPSTGVGPPVDVAAADHRADIGAAALAVTQQFAGNQRMGVTVLTPGVTVTPNLALNNMFTLAPAQNFTLANPTGQAAGQSGSIRIQQDVTGSRIITWGTDWKFPGGVEPALSTAANAIDRVDYEVWSSGEIHAALAKGLA